MSKPLSYVPVSALTGFAVAVFERLGLAPEDAAEVADCLITAELRGIPSHGVNRIRVYARRLRRGLVEPAPAIGVERTAAGVVLVDGGNGMGAVVGKRAMAEAVALADGQGVGVAVARRSNHFGIASYYAMRALEHDCIGLAVSNAAPTMAPWGGRQPFLGTNPLAAAVPAGKRPAIVIDMATSVVARGKIVLAAQRGERIPEGWALDGDGRPTTDAEKALGGVVLPFAGPKGSALAILVDVVSGLLSGAAFGRAIGSLYTDFDRPQGAGHLFAALNIAAFLPVDEFKARVDALIAALKGSAPAEGHDEVLMPGEPELRNAAARRRTGVPLEADVVDGLREVGEELKLAFPECSTRPLA